jgi:HD-GYP domain-containing protein (c-di-GMP phosphodiesterase class II)
MALVRGSTEEPRYLVVQFQDITARREADAELRRYADQLAELARQDSITGLPNDREFRSQLPRAPAGGPLWPGVEPDAVRDRRVSRIEQRRSSPRRPGARSYRPGNRGGVPGVRSTGADRRRPVSPILPNTAADESRATATRIAALVEKAGLATLSHGAVTWPQDGDTAELLARADVGLQKARPAHLSATSTTALASDACPTDAIQELVDVARQFLEMDVAYLAKIEEDVQTFATLAGNRDSFGLAVGDALDLDASYCKRMLEGQIPNAVTDVAAEADLATLAITGRAGIGAYLGVPVILPNGHTYDTLCAINHEPMAPVPESSLDVMRSFASLIASHVEHDVIEAIARRSGAEVTGVNALLSALTARDHYTGEQSEIVVRLASAVARHIGLAPDEVHEVQQVALLHDIGKVGIPDSILQKRGPLTDDEWEVMHQHPTIGARILTGVPMFAHLVPAGTAEHERFDGTGYPDGLQGSAIPLASRITFACDAYHAMTSDRPYRRALDVPAARAELQLGSGTQFDPAVVDALLEVLDGLTTRQHDFSLGVD